MATPEILSWDDRLRGAGLRATAPRRAVLRLLASWARPATHAEVARALEPDAWDRATVYRNLCDLAEAGILTRSDMGDHVWRFELARAEEHGHESPSAHPHFVCTTCGEVSCLPDLALPVERVPVAVRTGKVEVRVHGVCDSCAA